MGTAKSSSAAATATTRTNSDATDSARGNRNFFSRKSQTGVSSRESIIAIASGQITVLNAARNFEKTTKSPQTNPTTTMPAKHVNAHAMILF